MSELRFRDLIINISISLISIFLSAAFLFFVLEVRHYIKNKEYLNQAWHDPNTQFDPELGWSPIPSRRIYYPGWGTISSNSLGFRSAEIDKSKNQIIILGDSVAWGFRVSDTETFPYFLDNLSLESGYQVSNLAVSGYGIDQYYLFLKRHIDKFNKLKAVVLVVTTYNDLANTATNCCYGKRKPLFMKKDNDLILTNSSINKYCLRNLFSNSYFFGNPELEKKKVGKFLGLIAGDKSLTQREGGEVAAHLFQKIYTLTLDHNAKFLVVLSPYKSDFIQKSEALKWLEYVFDTVKISDLSCIDYIETLKNNQKELDSIYLDEGHYTKKGNLLLAETVYKYLQKELNLK